MVILCLTFLRNCQTVLYSRRTILHSQHNFKKMNVRSCPQLCLVPLPQGPKAPLRPGSETPPHHQAAVVARTLGPHLVQPQQHPVSAAVPCPCGCGGLRQQGQGAGDGWTSPVSRTTWLRRDEGRPRRSWRERPPTECAQGQAQGTADLTVGAAGVSALTVKQCGPSVSLLNE